MQAWEADHQSRLSKLTPKAATALLKSPFNVYLDYMKVIEESAMKNPKKFQQAIEVKKLFAIPWLLASDILFSKHDFLVRVFGSEEVKMKQEQAKKPAAGKVSPFKQLIKAPSTDEAVMTSLPCSQ